MKKMYYIYYSYTVVWEYFVNVKYNWVVFFLMNTLTIVLITYIAIYMLP